MTLEIDNSTEVIAILGGTHHIAAYLAVIKAALQAHNAGNKVLHVDTPANMTRKQVMGVDAAYAQHLAALKVTLDIIEQQLGVRVVF